MRGEGVLHARWERILAWSPSSAWQQSLGSLLNSRGHLASRSTAGLDDAWAELEALNTFVGYASDLEIRLPPSGADIRIRRKTSGRTILVEVNREAV